MIKREIEENPELTNKTTLTKINQGQEENYKQTAILTKYIREIQPQNITISVGGEIGHIGGKNSTLEEFNAFMRGYNMEISNEKIQGISKISAQTGSSHGGTVGPDGKIIDVDIDFEILSTIGDAARKKYGIGGVVQHAASTLPDELFSHFPKHNTLEIHLATEFQNQIFEYMSEQLKQRVKEWVLKNCKEEREKTWSEVQFIYKLRKKALGPFKKELWDLKSQEKNKILEKAINNEEIINKYIKEQNISLEIAKKYRKKINPAKTILSDKDVAYIRNKIVNKVKAELILRISKGYKNINLGLIESMIDKVLKDVNII